MEVEVEISDQGEVTLEAPQQAWSIIVNNTVEHAYFAGQLMVAAKQAETNPELFELHYLGLVGRSFESMETAKDFAPAFAKEVLRSLSSIVEEPETE